MPVAANHPNQRPAGGRALYITCLLLLTALALYPVVPHEFLYYDDGLNVKENPRMNPPRWDRVGRYWQRPYLGMYIPVTYTAWTAIAQAARTPDADEDGNYLNPWIFHAANLLTHELTVLLVFLLLLDLVEQPLAAALGAAFFAIHPVQVEPIAWVTGFRDMLGGFFSVLALWQYLRWARGSRGAGAYAIATTAFVLAMLSKTASLPVPVIAWILDALILSRGWVRPLKSLWPWLLIALAGAIMLKMAQPDANPLVTVLPAIQRVRIALDSLGFYVAKLLWPVPLVPDYARTPEAAIAASPVLAILGAALLITLAMCLWRKWRTAAAAIGLFVVGVLPVLGLVPFDYQQHSTVADRYLYISLLAPALAIAVICAQRRRAGIAIALGVLYLGLAILSWRQTHIWKDNLTFHEYIVQSSPDSWMGHVNLSKVYLLLGQTDRAYDQAEQARRLKPMAANVYTHLGFIYEAKAEPDLALAQFREAARLAPRDSGCQRNLARTLSEQGQLAEAQYHFDIALQLAPEDQNTLNDYAEHKKRVIAAQQHSSVPNAYP